MITGLFKRLTVLVVSTLVAAGIALGATYVQGIPIRAANDKTVALFGDNVSLCNAQNMKSTRRASVKLKGQIGVINANNMRIYQEYQDALAPERQPKGVSELAGILCIREKRTEVNVDKYSSPTSSKVYFCTQYGRDLEVWLIDVSTKKVVAYDLLNGTQPPECPDKTDSSLTKTGELPPPSDIADWVS